VSRSSENGMSVMKLTTLERGVLALSSQDLRDHSSFLCSSERRVMR
jgi:hypothetical protein